MKKCIVTVASICMLSISAYAGEFNCDYKYNEAINKINSASSEISKETKSKWISQLKKSHQLCEDGKEKQAVEILEKLNNEKEWDMMFSTYDKN
jgi:hypothetical protein